MRIPPFLGARRPFDASTRSESSRAGSGDDALRVVPSRGEGRPAQGAWSPPKGAGVLAVVFLAFHLPLVPAFLEDVDSINFALGVRQFDVARHQPHPPGYPLFMFVAKGVNEVARDEAKAIATVGIVAGALGAFAFLAFCRRLERRGLQQPWPLAATILVVTSPLYWFTAGRPLSDVAGLVAATGVQALTLSATRGRTLAAAAFFAGLAAGLRSQVVWLTVPLLAWAIGRHRVDRGRLIGICAAAYAAGALVWAVPLMILSGGPAAYWRALFSQGAEDLSGVQMLWTSPSPRVLASALYHAFVAPWARWSVAAIVLLLAGVGVIRLYRHDARALATLAVAFVPYLVLDLLFQETVTTRYALPLVVPVAYLAVHGAAGLGTNPALAIVLALSVYDAHAAGTSVAAYARQKAPAFRLLDAMSARAREEAVAPVLATDRRQYFDLRRPIEWVGNSMPALAGRLPAPPQHEWLELVKYWNGGGRAPVWFVVDPKRAQVDLIDHPDPIRYRWTLPHPVLMGGVRPNEMDWYRLDRPEWYVGEGWALTPEAAGVSEIDRRGLAHGQIEAWIHRSVLGAGRLLIGGRNFEPAGQTQVTLAIDDHNVDELTVMPGAFLHVSTLPAVAVDPAATEYHRLTIEAAPPARVGIEQFGASSRRPLLGFGAGWQEPEFNPTTGLRWRWLSERGELRIVTRDGPIALRIEGDSPLRYYSRPSRLVVRARARVLFDRQLSSDFAETVTIPAGALGPDGIVTLETDQIFVPADQSRGSLDRRHLGLRIFTCELRPAR